MRERRRVMIAGTGEKCLLKSLLAKNIDLRKKTQSSLTKNANTYLFKTDINNAINDNIIEEQNKRNPCGCLIF